MKITKSLVQSLVCEDSSEFEYTPYVEHGSSLVHGIITFIFLIDV